MKKEDLEAKHKALLEKAKAFDLARDDPSTFVPLIKEIEALGKQINGVEEEVNKLSQGIKFLRNKHGGENVAEKVD